MCPKALARAAIAHDKNAVWIERAAVALRSENILWDDGFSRSVIARSRQIGKPPTNGDKINVHGGVSFRLIIDTQVRLYASIDKRNQGPGLVIDSRSSSNPVIKGPKVA
jgi:hypothetical protein